MLKYLKYKIWNKVRLTFRYIRYNVRLIKHRLFYKLINFILKPFGYIYLNARYDFGNFIIRRVPFGEEDYDISDTTTAVVCHKSGFFRKGAARRIVLHEDSPELSVRRTLFGDTDIIYYWDFGYFSYEEKKE